MSAISTFARTNVRPIGTASPGDHINFIAGRRHHVRAVKHINGGKAVRVTFHGNFGPRLFDAATNVAFEVR